MYVLFNLLKVTKLFQMLRIMTRLVDNYRGHVIQSCCASTHPKKLDGKVAVVTASTDGWEVVIVKKIIKWIVMTVFF